MSGKKHVSNIQQVLSQYVGQDVRLKANNGRKRYTECNGILDGTYSNLFVVRIQEKTVERKLSFRYTDLLTGNVVLMLCRNGKLYPFVVHQSRTSQAVT